MNPYVSNEIISQPINTNGVEKSEAKNLDKLTIKSEVLTHQQSGKKQQFGGAKKLTKTADSLEALSFDNWQDAVNAVNSVNRKLQQVYDELCEGYWDLADKKEDRDYCDKYYKKMEKKLEVVDWYKKELSDKIQEVRELRSQMDKWMEGRRSNTDQIHEEMEKIKNDLKDRLDGLWNEQHELSEQFKIFKLERNQYNMKLQETISSHKMQMDVINNDCYVLKDESVRELEESVEELRNKVDILCILLVIIVVILCGIIVYDTFQEKSV